MTEMTTTKTPKIAPNGVNVRCALSLVRLIVTVEGLRADG